MGYIGQWLGQTLGQNLGQDFCGHDVKAKFADGSFTNASARYLSYDGETEKFAGGVPAIRTINGRKYMQIETAATSLLPYCDKYDEANWNSNELTLVDEAVTTIHTDFDGWSLTPTAVSDVHSLYDTYNVDGSSQYVWSGVFKANGYNFVLLRFGEAGFADSPFAYFNLSTGAVGNSGDVDTVGIKDMGGGYYRCYISATSDAAADGEPLIAVCDQDYNLYTPTSYSGDTAKGILCCQTQLEIGNAPSSLIKTVASSVTRAADVFYWPSAVVPSALRKDITIDLKMIRRWDDPIQNAPRVINYDDTPAHACYFYIGGAATVLRYGITGLGAVIAINGVTWTDSTEPIVIIETSKKQVTLSGFDAGDGSDVSAVSIESSGGDVYYGCESGGGSQINALIGEPR